MSKLSWQLEYMYSLERFGIRMGLGVMEELMRGLGRPHEKFKSVHITGTNGKGSTAILTANALQEAGYRVGFYNSPHLIRFNERVRVMGTPITDEELSSLIGEMQDVVEKRELSITFFEFTTALAFLYFARHNVEIAVVEVGMGGDLDATNVIHPLVAAITNIAYDHTRILGKTKKEIAIHKAGIFKPGSVAVTAEENPSLVQYFASVAQERGATFYRVQDTIRAEFIDSTLQEQRFRTSGMYEAEFRMPLLGKHQLMNASTALTILFHLSHLGFNVPLSAIERAFTKTHWEGRLTVASQEPLILVDGAHNEAGIRALREFLDDIPNCHGVIAKPKTLVLALKKNKELAPMAKLIVPLFEEVVVTEGNYEPWPAEDLARQLSKYHPKVRAIANVQEALVEAQRNLHVGELMLVTGSLYMIGDALAALEVPVAKPPIQV